MNDNLHLSTMGYHACTDGGVIFQTPGEQATVADIVDFLPELNMNGWRSYRTGLGGTSDAKHKELRTELLNHRVAGDTEVVNLSHEGGLDKLAKWLTAFKRSTQWTRSSSYGLKHVFERETGVYVPNGLFVTGVLLAGFEARYRHDSPNLVFKMSRPAVR